LLVSTTMSRGSAFLLAVSLVLDAQAPVIRVDTRLVEVNVIVRDQNNRPVEGLTKADFTIFDRNKEQKIALFSVGSVHKFDKPAAPSPAGVYTNRPEQRAESPTSITVVLVDAVNTQIQDQVYAKQQFIKFLKQIGPEDRVAVYALGNKLRILQDFTSDPKAMLNSLARFRGDPLSYANDTDPAMTFDENMDQWLNDKNALLAENAIERRVAATVGAMEAIANHIGRLPGRKNLVWITGSFPFTIGQRATENVANWNDLPDPQVTKAGGAPTSQQTLAAAMNGDAGSAKGSGGDAYAQAGVSKDSLPGNTSVARTDFAAFEADVNRATKALNQANIAVYPVDARGLITVPKIMTAQSPGIIRSSKGGSGMSLPAIPMTPAGINTMQVMAENTGGRAFYNTNDIQHAIRDAIDDSEVTYTLGFYADSKTLDSQFHKLKVAVGRKHMDVRYRKGYLATPAGAPGSDEREAAMRDALWSPLDSGTVALSGSIDRVQEPKPNGLRLTVAVDPTDLMFEEHDGLHKVSVEFRFALLAADGRNLDTISQSKTMDLNAVQYEEFSKRFVVTKTLEPNPAVAQIRVVLFDRGSGRLGSLTIPAK
jgi:VWFA-related protein